MRYMKWIGLAAGVLLIVSCFSPWVVIESRQITISGIDANGTNFGKPGYLHLLFAILFVILNFIPRIWAKRFNLPVVALNSAWALRNYLMIATCQAGECPSRKSGIYMLLLASLLMLVAALFPDMKLQQVKKK
jgi:hypothetical protein